MTLTSVVLDFFRTNPDDDFHYTDIAKATGITETQVFSSVAHLRRSGHTVDSPLKGWYRYVGPPKKTADQLPLDETVSVGARATVVSVLRDGRPLLSLDGRLFVASELDIEV